MRTLRSNSSRGNRRPAATGAGRTAPHPYTRTGTATPPTGQPAMPSPGPDQQGEMSFTWHFGPMRSPAPDNAGGENPRSEQPGESRSTTPAGASRDNVPSDDQTTVETSSTFSFEFPLRRSPAPMNGSHAGAGSATPTPIAAPTPAPASDNTPANPTTYNPMTPEERARGATRGPWPPQGFLLHPVHRQHQPADAQGAQTPPGQPSPVPSPTHHHHHHHPVHHHHHVRGTGSAPSSPNRPPSSSESVPAPTTQPNGAGDTSGAVPGPRPSRDSAAAADHISTMAQNLRREFQRAIEAQRLRDQSPAQQGQPLPEQPSGGTPQEGPAGTPHFHIFFELNPRSPAPGPPPAPEEPREATPPAPAPEPVERPSLDSWVEGREKRLGWRCDAVVCGLAPTDEDGDEIMPSVTEEFISIMSPIQPPIEAGEQPSGFEIHSCEHRWHRSCLETYERSAGHSLDSDEDGRIWVRCEKCRKPGWIPSLTRSAGSLTQQENVTLFNVA